VTTIKEIAKLSNVSATTVSNVIHKRYEKVSKEKRQIVEETIEKLNYSPNMGAMILANKLSKIIGVISFLDGREDESPLLDPYVAGMIGSLEENIRNRGYYTMLHCSSSSKDLLKIIGNWKFSGLVLMGIEPDMYREVADKIKIPIVLVDSYFLEKFQKNGVESLIEHFNNVGINDFQGGFAMTEYLIDKGHRNIAFVSDEKKLHGPGKKRYEGYCSALKKYNLKPFDCFTVSKHQDVRWKRYDKILERGLPLNITAVFYASDFYALDCIRFLAVKKISVPDFISVVGFDDSEYAKYSIPPITTVKQNLKSKSECAIDRLTYMIENDDNSFSNEVLDTELVIRDSVRDLN